MLSEMVSDPDPDRAERVMQALVQTKRKICIADLLRVYEG